MLNIILLIILVVVLTTLSIFGMSLIENNSIKNLNVKISSSYGWFILLANILCLIGNYVIFCRDNPRNIKVDFDYLGFIVGVLGILVTILVGWQIFSILSLKKDVNKIVDDKLEDIDIKVKENLKEGTKKIEGKIKSSDVKINAVLNEYTEHIDKILYDVNNKVDEKLLNVDNKIKNSVETLNDRVMDVLNLSYVLSFYNLAKKDELSKDYNSACCQYINAFTHCSLVKNRKEYLYPLIYSFCKDGLRKLLDYQDPIYIKEVGIEHFKNICNKLEDVDIHEFIDNHLKIKI